MLSKSSSLKRLQLNAFGYATWKSYSDLRKKAVEQEFTWGGFVISLSIAFLFVFSGSVGLNALYEKTLDRNPSYPESSHTLIIESMPHRVLAFGSTC